LLPEQQSKETSPVDIFLCDFFNVTNGDSWPVKSPFKKTTRDRNTKAPFPHFYVPLYFSLAVKLIIYSTLISLPFHPFPFQGHGEVWLWRLKMWVSICVLHWIGVIFIKEEEFLNDFFGWQKLSKLTEHENSYQLGITSKVLCCLFVAFSFLSLTSYKGDGNWMRKH
jgi:hypothetical protein